MSKRAYAPAARQGAQNGGIPGRNAGPVFNLTIREASQSPGYLLVEAVTPHEFGGWLEGYEAWPDGPVIQPDEVAVRDTTGELDMVIGGLGTSSFELTCPVITGFVQVWIKPGARGLMSADGWTCAGLMVDLTWI